MGDDIFSKTDYDRARCDYGVSSSCDVTHEAEEQARKSGCLNEIVDPAVDPVRRSMIRLNPHRRKWIVTVGCPMDIEVSCDTTGSMGGEVDTEMEVLPDLYMAVAKVVPGYDPQFCLGIFGDVCDKFVMCRPQFEMEAPKIVKYLKEMAPQRNGGDSPEDPQYAMFARAYLTDAYTNRIGLKGYHFIVTDATCHRRIKREDISRIFGDGIFDNELKDINEVPTMEEMIKELKLKTHQFILLIGTEGLVSESSSLYLFWEELCGGNSVILINSTRQLPTVISAIIGLTEGTLDIGDLEDHLGEDYSTSLVRQLSKVEIGAQAKLRHQLLHPVPSKGDIFASKGDLWPMEKVATQETDEAQDGVQYL